MRWLNGVVGTVAVAVGLTASGLALAAPSPDSLQRSAETFTEWTDGPRHDMQDFGTGQYQFEGQVVGGARRTVDSASTRYPPNRLTNPDTARLELQALYDGILHDRPNPPDNGLQETADPALLPDWNDNGIYGEAGSGLGDRGDWDLDLDTRRDVGWFRYPTFHDDGTVTHDADPVLPADPPSPGTMGVALEAGFINSRGLFIDATLWLPGDAVTPLGPQRSDIKISELAGHPAIVFSDGVSSSQVNYYWFAEAMAARGYVVLTYDPAGQGQSEGTWSDTFQPYPEAGDCYFGGACLDLQDAVRWMVGDPIEPRNDLKGLAGGQVRPFSDPKDPATNPTNPSLPAIDVDTVGLAGNSMGALATLKYLTASTEGGSTLPHVGAAVAMSGATASAVANVPLQLQTSDFDGSPTLVGPGVGGVNLGGQGEGIGYYIIKDMFDRLRVPAPDNDLSLIVFKGGVHTDHVRVPYVPRTLWSTNLASHYAGLWFDCHLKDGDSCDHASTRVPHVSEAFGSEAYSADGAKTCISGPPSAMSLNYDAQDLAAMRPRDCFGRVGAGNG